ncbi:hypothetical protein C8R46DRAFT_1023783 [Mycena filopes]|nr:hypothetical protein C8R46DRAFT_1023783 [Mycena filopes]
MREALHANYDLEFDNRFIGKKKRQKHHTLLNATFLMPSQPEVNLLVRYLQGTQLGPIGSNSPLSLVKDANRCPMRTYLYRDREDKAVWSLTWAPFSTTHPNPDYSPPNAVVFTVASEDDWRKDTVCEGKGAQEPS